MGISSHKIRRRAIILGLPMKSGTARREPSRERWLAIAAEEAFDAGLSLNAILTTSERGNGSQAIARARWRAWRRLLDEDSRYSIAGIGRVTGWDWTTILHGLKRLEGYSPVDLRDGAVSRASGRYPIP